jgi:1-deoxy-D-xylulose-5-phosphate reductoisomerase
LKPKNIAILGSTGSIGTQALEVVRANPHLYKVVALTAQRNADLLIQQALEFKPEVVVICEDCFHQQIQAALPGITILAKEEGLIAAATWPQVDLVLTAVVGSVGLKPTIKAIEAGKDIALANKETLVVAGELVMALAKQHQVKIIPVDSEHSAIFQCLVGEEQNSIEKIILTASGGPFRGREREFLSLVTKQQALKHPNWVMGAKITIDSASLMNKGLEVIEAKWLFNVQASQVEVVVHPQSIIHSMVQFTDGSIKAQMGLPDMKLPIHYAFSHPNRLKSDFERFSFLKHSTLSFEAPDLKNFRNLALAFRALELGGNIPCVLNAANEVVVDAFLNDKIGFLAMSEVIEQCMEKVDFIKNPNLDDFLETDKLSRIFASELLKK